MRKIKKIISALIVFITIIIIVRVFVGETCHIPSPSMESTIMTGDFLWINKAVYGAKLPVCFADIPLVNIFTWIPFLREADLKNNWGYHRFPGFQKPRIKDVVVFNSIENATILLVKRIHSIVYKGSPVDLNLDNYEMIKTIVERDGNILTLQNDSIYINGKFQSIYTPQQNYYYMLADNPKNSYDSRNYGYIPESHIVGKASIALWSIDKEQGGFNKIRKDRFLHRIQ